MSSAGPAIGFAACTISAVAMLAALAAWGDRVLYAMAWAIVTLAEVAR